MKLPAFVLAGVAAAAAGTAIAASPRTHVMDVPLPDGAVAHVEYAGDVAPRVSIKPAATPSDDDSGLVPSFASFHGLIEQMNSETQAMLKQTHGMMQQGKLPGLNVASFGNQPAGTSSVSVVSYSNGAGSCTKTTAVVSQGAGKPPRVTTNVSGNCSAQGRTVPAPAATAVDRT
jgi:hypothetical protein